MNTSHATPPMSEWSSLNWWQRRRYGIKTHKGDPRVFGIYMGANIADPSHIVGYFVQHVHTGEPVPARMMSNNWRCAIVRWMIRRLLP